MKKILFSIAFFLTFLMATTVCAQTLRELFDQGVAAYQSGDYDKAIEHFESALKVDPNFAPTYNMLGLVYKEKNASPSELAWYFKTATDIDPKYAEAYDNLGKVYYGVGQFDRAEEYCKKALTINPNFVSSQFSLAWVYLLGKSQPSDAAYYFKKVLDRSKIPYAYLGLGIAYFMLDERAMVLDVITSLREINQDKLAEQLESIVRDYYYVPDAEGGSLVKIEPPPEEEIAALEQTTSQSGQVTGQMGGQVSTQISGLAPQPMITGTSKIRLRGTFFNVDGDQEGASLESSTALPKKIFSSSRTGSASVNSQTTVSPAAGAAGQTIEIRREAGY